MTKQGHGDAYLLILCLVASWRDLQRTRDTGSYGLLAGQCQSSSQNPLCPALHQGVCAGAQEGPEFRLAVPGIKPWDSWVRKEGRIWRLL